MSPNVCMMLHHTNMVYFRLWARFHADLYNVSAKIRFYYLIQVLLNITHTSAFKTAGTRRKKSESMVFFWNSGGCYWWWFITMCKPRRNEIKTLPDWENLIFLAGSITNKGSQISSKHMQCNPKRKWVAFIFWFKGKLVTQFLNQSCGTDTL